MWGLVMAIWFTVAGFHGQGANQGLRPHWLDLLSLFLQPLSISTKLHHLRVVVNELTTFSDGCLGSNNDEGRSEV